MYRSYYHAPIRHLSQIVSCVLQSVTINFLTLNTVAEVLSAAEVPIKNVIDTVAKLSQAASKMPYYKFNNMWSRQMQGAVRGNRASN